MLLLRAFNGVLEPADGPTPFINILHFVISELFITISLMTHNFILFFAILGVQPRSGVASISVVFIPNHSGRTLISERGEGPAWMNTLISNQIQVFVTQRA